MLYGLSQKKKEMVFQFSLVFHLFEHAAVSLWDEQKLTPAFCNHAGWMLDLQKEVHLPLGSLHTVLCTFASIITMVNEFAGERAE